MTQGERRENSISLTQGYWFFFDVNGDQFAFHGSGWSGRERVWVNDKLVSDKRSWSRQATHDFEYAGDQYALTFAAQDLAQGVVVCTLRCAGEIVGHAEQKFFHSSGRSSSYGSLLKLLGYVFAFAAAAYFCGYWVGRLVG